MASDGMGKNQVGGDEPVLFRPRHASGQQAAQRVRTAAVASPLRIPSRPRAALLLLIAISLLASSVAACLPRRVARPTPTPRPLRATFTPTPPKTRAAQAVAVAAEAAVVATPLPPTATPPPPPPTNTPLPTPTPASTPTNTPTATPEPEYRFTLEASEQFPAAGPEGVRVFLYVYSLAEFALPGYSLRVTWNGNEMAVPGTSTGGLPRPTRPEPGPYTRLANLDVEFRGPRGGEWRIQLIDAAGTPVGPPAIFTLANDSSALELYVRYREGR